jgi:hypothetical protein
MFPDVNGIRLCYEAQGDGWAVVLVHGLGLSGDSALTKCRPWHSAIARPRSIE